MATYNHGSRSSQEATIPDAPANWSQQAIARHPWPIFRVGTVPSELPNASPNPSIERTHNGGAQCLAPSRAVPPLCAAHVKR